LWERWGIDGPWLVPESVPIWQGLVEPGPQLPEFWPRSNQTGNRNTCLTLLAVAGGVGAIVYWVRRPRIRPLEADDYSDGPGGSVLDGRG
jgi:hypothetical protein